MEPLTIKLSEATQRKLGAIAVLTGRTYNQILDTASELVDGLIADELVRCVTTTTGRTASAIGMVPQTEPTPLHQQTRAQFDQDPRPEEQTGYGAEEKEESLFGQFSHGLSNDADDGEDTSPVVEVPGVEIPVAAAAPQRRTAAPKQQVKTGPSTLDDALRVDNDDVVDVGEDAEAFLEGIVDTVEEPQEQSYSAGYAGVGPQYSNRPRKPSGAFHPSRPRVKISDHTGDEE